jgi:hypothetical protein
LELGMSYLILVQERKISEELKKLLALEKGKVEKLDQ